MSVVPFVVLDTNVVLDWLVYQDKRVAPLIGALQAGLVRLASDQACLLELIEVLSRATIRASAEQRRSALETYRSMAHMVQEPSGAAATAQALLATPAGKLPQCRDPDDQKFVELAVRCGARALVSRDKELLRMHHAMMLIARLAVIQPAEALAQF